MKNKKKNKIIKKKTVKLSGILIVVLFLIASIFIAGIPLTNAHSNSLPPKTIWGYVIYQTGDAAVGVTVIVSSSGYPDKTDTTDSVGAYQVDIGSDTGTEWPNDTPFTVIATKRGWKGSSSGIVVGTLTQCDVSLVKAKSIQYPIFYLFFEKFFQRFPMFAKILNQII